MLNYLTNAVVFFLAESGSLTALQSEMERLRMRGG